MSWIESVRTDISAIRSTLPELRKFGITVGTVFLLLGALAYWRGWWEPAVTGWVTGTGLMLAVVGLLSPASLKGLHRLWMSAAVLLGSIVSRFLLVLIFFIILTPIALLARWTGKRFLSEQHGRSAGTYWVERKKDPKIDYERLS
jgi:hypothetical protein